MRISIRTQLGSLFLLSSLVSVAVVSIALYLTLQQLVLVLRGQRLALTASLKATQVASALGTMDDIVQVISAREWLREVITSYNAGNRSDELFEYVRKEFSYALTGTQQQAIALQVQVIAAIGGPPMLNVTAIGATQPPMLLPYYGRNGSELCLGYGPEGFPPPLYPNTTMIGNATAPAVSINHRELKNDSGILLGPLHLNDSVTLFSISRVITDADDGSTIGWLTVILNGRNILRAVQSHVGLSRTGTSLVLAPYTVDNRFALPPLRGRPMTLAGTRLLRNGTEMEDAQVHRVLPAARSLKGLRQHHGPADAFDAPPFNVSSDPTLKMALGRNLSTVNNAGGVTLLRNQAGVGISVGFALVNSSLCDWIYQVEYSDTEILSATRKLRNVALICIFSTIALMLCLFIPVTGIWSQPIIRLRNATSESIRPPSLHNSSTKGSIESLVLDARVVQPIHGEPDPALKEAHPISHSLRVNMGHGKSKSASSLPKKFRIPQQVKERKTFVEDELTDLTRVFNQMSDELEKQYSSMEERVKLRTYELEVSKKAAEAANESKSHFIANISHELKTPLNHILGMTQTCLQEDNIAQIKDSLTVIERSGELLNNHLTDLLTFSKNQAGKALALDEKRFRLGDIAAQIRAIFNHQAKSKGINFQVTYVAPEGDSETTQSEVRPSKESMKTTVVWGDLFRILQVVINLVGNSLKFTPEGGSIDLYIRQLQKLTVLTPCISIRSSCHEDTWSKYAKDLASAQGDDDEGDSSPPSLSCLVDFEFEVVDTGPGIQKAMQEQIFKPFVQGDAGLARKHGGTGLGLSICSQLAELMNGQIVLQSEVGRGSKFTLELPLNLIEEGQRDTSTRTSVGTRDAASTIASVLDHDQISSELFSHSGMHLPGQRSASHVTTSTGSAVPTKTRLIGLTQPYFSNATPPRTPVEEAVPDVTFKIKQNLKVLVAEDNVTNQQVVLRMLRLEEVVNVHIAKDGQEALERVIESIAAKIPYDLVLMDVQMPRLDGRQSTKLIRKAGFSAPVVALTAFADEKNEKECMDAGMDFFLEKPIKRDKLRRVLKRCSMDGGSTKTEIINAEQPVGEYFGSST